MPIKKSFYKKKFQKKTKKPMYKSRISRGIVIPNVHNFKRTVTLYNGSAPNRYLSITNTAYDILGNYALSFKLTDLPNSSEFTTLFDEFMIYKVVLDIRPLQSSMAVNISSTTQAHTQPYLHYVIDHDDDTALVALSEYQEYNSYNRFMLGQRRKITIYPKIASANYISGVSTGYSSARRYVDCSNASTPHYGFKFGINGAGLSVTTSYGIDIEATYYIKLRGVR